MHHSVVWEPPLREDLRWLDLRYRWRHWRRRCIEVPHMCGVVFFTSLFHLGGRHARPFTRNLEGECARGGMNFISVLPTITHELSYLSYELERGKKISTKP